RFAVVQVGELLGVGGILRKTFVFGQPHHVVRQDVCAFLGVARADRTALAGAGCVAVAIRLVGAQGIAAGVGVVARAQQSSVAPAGLCGCHVGAVNTAV